MVPYFAGVPFFFVMDVTFSVGARFVDGRNLDADVLASIAVDLAEQEISASVTGLVGTGYEPGQKNLDGSDL